MSLSVKGLFKRFGNLSVFDDLSLDIKSGCISTFVGPSGCGKSTLLNLVSGLDQPDSGTIRKNEPAERIGYMMQEPHLLPWRTIAENATIGVEVIKGSYRHDALLQKYLDAFELDSHAEAYPAESSGGMKQRAALIRTLLTQPKILLLDEPFASLDFDIKLKVQREIVEYHRHSGAATVLVTHDIEDAIALSDWVMVFSESPARIKVELAIDLGTADRDPVEARKSPKFRDYFVKIWDELKYLDGEDDD